MAAITYKNASCIYEGSDKLAVDNLNLDIQDGEFIVLVGPSGSGKSTALRMLAGLEDIDEGSIEIGGKEGESKCESREVSFRRQRSSTR